MKQKKGFYLFAVDADRRLRYERVKLRSGTKDDVSFEQFLAHEEQEMRNEDPASQNLSRCIELADYRLVNNGSREELREQVDMILQNINQSSL